MSTTEAVLIAQAAPAVGLR